MRFIQTRFNSDLIFHGSDYNCHLAYHRTCKRVEYTTPVAHLDFSNPQKISGKENKLKKGCLPWIGEAHSLYKRWILWYYWLFCHIVHFRFQKSKDTRKAGMRLRTWGHCKSIGNWLPDTRIHLICNYKLLGLIINTIRVRNLMPFFKKQLTQFLEELIHYLWHALIKITKK